MVSALLAVEKSLASRTYTVFSSDGSAPLGLRRPRVESVVGDGGKQHSVQASHSLTGQVWQATEHPGGQAVAASPPR